MALRHSFPLRAKNAILAALASKKLAFVEIFSQPRPEVSRAGGRLTVMA